MKPLNAAFSSYATTIFEACLCSPCWRCDASVRGLACPLLPQPHFNTHNRHSPSPPSPHTALR
jgi:hypothetical protein